MSGNKPVTFADLEVMMEHRNLPIRLREGTHAEWGGHDKFDLFCNGNLIASVFRNGTVRLSDKHLVSAQSRNRMNDVLIPLGWGIKMDNHKWVLETILGHVVPYQAGMTVVPVINRKEG